MAMFCGSIMNRQLLSTLRKVPSVMSVAGCCRASPKISYEAYTPPQPMPHDDKNAKLHRPMSPHLTIYAKQLTSMTSITHRITGMALSGYFIALGCGALVLPNDISHYISMVEGLSLSSSTLFAAKLTLALPFGYHLANGIRHLLWDSGRILTLKQVYATGYIMIAASIAISAAIASL